MLNERALMKPRRTATVATGWLLVIIGGTMALVIGKGDLTVITAGIFTSFGGIYVLSLVDPATRQFIGNEWIARLCRLSAGIMGMLMAFSGLIGSINGIRETMIFHNPTGLSLIFIGLLSFCWGIYILNLTIIGIQSQHFS